MGRWRREGYTVEKVYFESYPGHFVTGSLYRPKGATEKLPGVLCPYGHFRDGRFNELTQKELDAEIANKAERFEVGGRYPLQAYPVQLRAWVAWRFNTIWKDTATACRFR